MVFAIEKDLLSYTKKQNGGSTRKNRATKIQQKITGSMKKSQLNVTMLRK